MRTISVITLALTLTSQCIAAYSDEDISRMKELVEAGNADAAWDLMRYYGNRDEAESDRWMRKAASLGQPEACRVLAYLIRDLGHDPLPFGSTPQEAVLKLLTSASKSSGTAAKDLGDAYYKGYLGATDKDKKAREAYLLAASLHNSSSWEDLAAMLHKGEGGKADQVEAYYFAGLAARCIHPESVVAEKLRLLRHEIEAALTIAEVKEVWNRVDLYIAKERMYVGGRIYQPAFGGNGVPEEKWNESMKATDDYERKLRSDLLTRRGEQAVTPNGP